MSFFVSKLSFKDWIHEFSLSVCGVLALASILTPIMVLHGVHTGIIEKMRVDLLKDPSVLVLMPSGSKGAGFSEKFIKEASERPECEYIIGRTRDVASELQLDYKGNLVTVSLEATSQSDPLLSRNGIVNFPKVSGQNISMVLSDSAAKKLGVSLHDVVEASLGRRLSSGRFEKSHFEIEIVDILPAKAIGQDMGFVSMDLLLDIQDFRDGYKTPILGGEGETPPLERYFESFRAYVHNLDEVEILEAYFKEKQVLVKTRSKDIANIRHVDKTLSSIVLVITFSSALGFFAFMFSTVHATVRRKWKMLGMLRLLGFSKMNMLTFPIVQSLITGVLGVLLSFIFYSIVDEDIALLFERSIRGFDVCIIHPLDFILLFFGVQGIVILSSLNVAVKASKIDPSVVIREN